MWLYYKTWFGKTNCPYFQLCPQQNRANLSFFLQDSLAEKVKFGCLLSFASFKSTSLVSTQSQLLLLYWTRILPQVTYEFLWIYVIAAWKKKEFHCILYYSVHTIDRMINWWSKVKFVYTHTGKKGRNVHF